MNENIIKAHQSQSQLANFTGTPDSSQSSATSALGPGKEPIRDTSKPRNW